jgi:hypothetical protein
VVVGEGALPAARRMAATLPPQERPRVWMERTALPLTASGKVDLVRLTRDVADG